MLPEILDAVLEDRGKQREPKGRNLSNHASQLGHPCLRRLVYLRLAADKAKPIGVGLRRVFDLGGLFEDYVRARLREAGVRVVAEQGLGDWEKYNIRGSIDGVIHVADLARAACGWGMPYDERDFGSTEAVILEIKSCGDKYWRALAGGDEPNWGLDEITLKWRAQCLLYCLLQGRERCVLLLVHKSSGELRQIDIVLEEHLDEAEALIKKAEVIEQFVGVHNHDANLTFLPEKYPLVTKENTDGPYYPPMPKRLEAPKICRRCEFDHICCPTLVWGPGLQEIESDEVAGALARRGELDAARTEYTRLDGEVKERFGLGEDEAEGLWIVRGAAGEWEVTAKRDARGAVRKAFRRVGETTEEEGGE